MQPAAGLSEHARDIFKFLRSERAAGARCALAAVEKVEGSSSRAVGTLMGVSERGRYAGYVSNGCVDADIALHALNVMQSGDPARVRYGVGSPYFDIKLPCGGAIEVIMIPIATADAVARGETLLRERQAISIELSEDQAPFLEIGAPRKQPSAPGNSLFIHTPPLHLSIAGNGEEAIALTRIARGCHYDATIYSSEARILEACAELGADTFRLGSLTDLPPLKGDRWSAFVTLFHEHDWEINLLTGALNTDNFYIGAMGSRGTHAARLEAMRQNGIDESALTKIRGPIGLIPSTRDAAKLALSTLAEVASLYPTEA